MQTKRFGAGFGRSLLAGLLLLGLAPVAPAFAQDLVAKDANGATKTMCANTVTGVTTQCYDLRLNGVAPAVGSGVVGPGVLRFVWATDQPQNTIPFKVDGSGVTQPVSASALPLPSGAATSAAQTTAQTSLSSIVTNTGAGATAAAQTTGNGSLAAILAKILAAPATEAKQDTGNTALSSILSKIIAAPATEAKQDATITAIGAATPAGENHIGQVGGQIVVATAAPTVSTSAYATGDVIGTKMTMAGLGRVTGGSGLIQMIGVQSKSAQTFVADLVIFHTDPSSSTFTDNAAFAVNVADYDKVIDVIHIASTDWTSLGTPSYASVVKTVGYKIAAGANDAYAVLVSRGAPTLASTSDLRVVVKAAVD